MRLAMGKFTKISMIWAASAFLALGLAGCGDDDGLSPLDAAVYPDGGGSGGAGGAGGSGGMKPPTDAATDAAKDGAASDGGVDTAVTDSGVDGAASDAGNVDAGEDAALL